jgi:hypothetical protein
MKKLIVLLMIISSANIGLSQACDSLTDICYKQLETNVEPGKSFISDGQVYKAFLDAEQVAEFKTTFYGGSTYRIASTAGVKDNYVIINVYDVDRNLLFSNKDFKNQPYWDFKVDNTLDCFVEATLDIDKKISGCIVVLIGFLK